MCDRNSNSGVAQCKCDFMGVGAKLLARCLFLEVIGDFLQDKSRSMDK
jgi:hypothetical protein